MKTLQLANVKNEKPEVMEALIKRAFSINRSGNAFAGVPVDMALEQSINAHVKNRLIGIMTCQYRFCSKKVVCDQSHKE